MIKTLGTLSGNILVFGGVYSNYQALQALQKVAKDNNIASNNIICTGDIAGYCAQPEECLQTVKNWGIHSISGNVEQQLSSGEESCGCDFIPGSRCDSFSKEWYPFAQMKVSQDAVQWMKQLPEFISFRYAGKDCLVVHGSFHNTSEFIFKSTPWATKQRNFDHTDTDVIISGHCGLPFNDIQNGKYWLNAGVIGMPANDATQDVWYMIIKTGPNGEFLFEHHSFAYDYKETHRLMTQYNLPEAYRKTILSGVWDNCEILPKEETAKQGQALDLNRIKV